MAIYLFPTIYLKITQNIWVNVEVNENKLLGRQSEIQVNRGKYLDMICKCCFTASIDYQSGLRNKPGSSRTLKIAQ